MPTTLLTVTATPSIFTSGNFPITVLNTGPAYRFVATPSLISTNGAFNGFEALLATNDNGGLYMNARRVELYNGSGSGTLVAQSSALTWSASQALTIKVNLAAGTNASSLVISGATTGNGTTTFTTSGTYFTATTLGVGQFTSSNTFVWSGTIGNIDDGVQGGTATGPAVAWTASAKGLRATTATGAAVHWSSAASGSKNGLFGTATAPAVVWSAAPGSIRARIQAGAPAAVAWISGASGAKTGTIALGVHGFDFQRFGFANRAWSIALNTHASGSIVLIAVGGHSSEVGSTWTDSLNVAGIRKLATVVDYPDFAGYGTQVGITPNVMTGGTGQTFSGPVATNDENTSFATECIGGARAKTINTNVANAGGSTTITSGTVVTDGAAMLIADWWGSSPVVPPFTGGVGTPYTAVPNNGFVVIDSYLINNQFGEVQAARAVKIVDVAGSYNVTWTHSPSQGAQTWMTALEPARSGNGTPAAAHWAAAPVGARTFVSAAAGPAAHWSASVTGVRSRLATATAPAITWSTSAVTGLRARLSAAAPPAVAWIAAALGQRRAAASGTAVAWSVPSVTGIKAVLSGAIAPAVHWSATPHGLHLVAANATSVPWSAAPVGLRTRIVAATAQTIAWSAAPSGAKSAVGQHPANGPAVVWTATVSSARALVRAAAAPPVHWSATTGIPPVSIPTYGGAAPPLDFYDEPT